RVFSLLNLLSIGLLAPTCAFANPDYRDLHLPPATVDSNRDPILGTNPSVGCNTTRSTHRRPLPPAPYLADPAGLTRSTQVDNRPPRRRDPPPRSRPPRARQPSRPRPLPPG